MNIYIKPKCCLENIKDAKKRKDWLKNFRILQTVLKDTDETLNI